MFEKTILSRDRVQSMALLVRIVEFRRGFTVVFESTIKPQREAQNGLPEHRILSFSGLLQWFSKRARKKYNKTADFWSRVRQGPIHSRKQVVWSTQAFSPQREHQFWQKTCKTSSGGGGHALNPGKHSV